MKRLFAFWSVVVLSFCGLLALADERMTTPRIENVRLGVDGSGQTRIVFDLSDHPSYVIRAVGDADPRLEVLISNSVQTMPVGNLPRQKGLVQAVAIEADVTQLRLTRSALPVKSFVLPPTSSNAFHRLVIDVTVASDRDFAAAVAAAPDFTPTEPPPETPVAPAPKNPAPALVTIGKTSEVAPNTPTEGPSAEAVTAALGRPDSGEAIATVDDIAPAPSLNPARIMGRSAMTASRNRLTIVLDPGHGGKDPGSTGSTGLNEKDVTLISSKLLKTELEKRGYRVLLTREGDTFIDLGRRMQFARENNADLFMSIHADSNPEPLARGATVYTLSDGRSEEMVQQASATGNVRVFDVEISEDDEVGRDVGSILFDLANTDTRNESVKLASALIAEMRGRVPMVRNTHRRGSLGVLLSPDVPAVLVELAFLSNKKDEANLASASWRRRAVGAVADGIDSYFGNNPRQVRAGALGAASSINP